MSIRCLLLYGKFDHFNRISIGQISACGLFYFYLCMEVGMSIVLVKPRRTLLSENFHTPMDSFHCWLYEAV